MRSRKEKIKDYFKITLIISTVFLIICFFVFIIDIDENIGVIPLVFFTSTIFNGAYLILDANFKTAERYYVPSSHKIHFKNSFLFNVILLFFSIIFTILSYYVLWK